MKAHEPTDILIHALEAYGFECEAGPLTHCKEWVDLTTEIRAFGTEWQVHDDLLLGFLDARRADVQKLSEAIEALPASEQQTAVSILASNLGHLFQERARMLREIRAKTGMDRRACGAVLNGIEDDPDGVWECSLVAGHNGKHVDGENGHTW